MRSLFDRDAERKKKVSFVLHLFIEIFSFVKKYINMRSLQLVKRGKNEEEEKIPTPATSGCGVGLFVVVPPR